MPRQKISKEQILEATYQMALEHGLHSVNARSIAARCGVSVGSIYNYYPSMDELFSDVIERFFRSMFSDASCQAAQGENFVTYIRRLYQRMQTALDVFQSDWLNQIESMNASMRAAGRRRESVYQAQIIQYIQHVFDADAGIVDSRLTSRASSNDIAQFVFYTLVNCIRYRLDAEPLFSMLEISLYQMDPKSVERR